MLSVMDVARGSLDLYDLPSRVDRSLYDDAMHEYANAVAPRAEAVYLTGNISYPGLSDLDLVVVTSCRCADNAQFLSSMYRLPARYKPILLHDPLVIPANHKHVLQYTNHCNLRLIAGNDVLSGTTFVDSPAERWCKLLEEYCTYAEFFDSVESTARCRGRRLIAKASALRFGLRDMDNLCATSLALEYEHQIDAIRADYFSREPIETLKNIWGKFKAAYLEWSMALREMLPLNQNESIQDFARRVFSGAGKFDKVPAEYARRRSAEIDRYHDELAHLRIPFGQIFFWEAHGKRSRIYRQSTLNNTIYRAKYKVQRLLAASASNGRISQQD
jgi:hypothetical protein